VPWGICWRWPHRHQVNLQVIRLGSLRNWNVLEFLRLFCRAVEQTIRQRVSMTVWSCSELPRLARSGRTASLALLRL